MKASANKKARKLLKYYSNIFGYKRPYQILIDATFCRASCQVKFEMEERLRIYLQSDIKCFTTQCIILEAENMGQQLSEVAINLKRLSIYRCGHDSATLSAFNCLRQTIKTNSFIVATQDRYLQQFLRQKSGQPLLYLHRSTPVLDPPTKQCRNSVSKRVELLFKKSNLLYLRKCNLNEEPK